MTGARALVLGGVAAGALLSLAAPTATMLWHASGDTAIAARELPPLAAGQEPEPVDTSALRALAPFGSDAPAPVGGPPEETALDLVLHGVAISSDPSRSAAFIGTGARTRRYLTGEAIADGVALTAVASDHVRLDVNGAEEILSFPNAPGPAETSAEEAAPAEIVAAAPMDRLGAAIVDGVRRERAGRPPPETVEDHIALWRDRIRRNPSQALGSIGLVPGEGGYTIAEDHDSGVARIGLRSGDVVTRVNGQAVGDVDRDKALYDEIAASGLATVEIERDGETITMSFPLR